MSMLGPTPQRVAKASDVDTPITDTKRRRQCFQIVGVVEMMHRRGSLRDDQLVAFKDFEKDLGIAYASRGLLSCYGTVNGGSGTPLCQLANDMFSLEQHRAERRSTAHERLAGAAKAIAEPRTLETLLAIATREATLEMIGRTILLIGNKTAAIAAASRTVQIGTYSLAGFYGRLKQTREPPA